MTWTTAGRHTSLLPVGAGQWSAAAWLSRGTLSMRSEHAQALGRDLLKGFGRIVLRSKLRPLQAGDTGCSPFSYTAF